MEGLTLGRIQQLLGLFFTLAASENSMSYTPQVPQAQGGKALLLQRGLFEILATMAVQVLQFPVGGRQPQAPSCVCWQIASWSAMLHFN